VPETKCEDLVREICLHTTIGVDRRGGLFFYDSRGDQIKREVRLALLPNHAKKHPPPAISSVAAPSMPSPPCAVRACLHENSHWSDWLGGALRCEPDPALVQPSKQPFLPPAGLFGPPNTPYPYYIDFSGISPERLFLLRTSILRFHM
jgi:hypothetical protein